MHVFVHIFVHTHSAGICCCYKSIQLNPSWVHCQLKIIDCRTSFAYFDTKGVRTSGRTFQFGGHGPSTVLTVLFESPVLKWKNHTPIDMLLKWLIWCNRFTYSYIFKKKKHGGEHISLKKSSNFWGGTSPSDIPLVAQGRRPALSCHVWLQKSGPHLL